MSDKMDDKTRILTTIIDVLQTSIILAKRGPFGSMVLYDGRIAPHFTAEHTHKPKPGDVVMCETGKNGPWKISYLVEHRDDRGGYNHLLREIGSNRLCEMGNESLSTLIGVDPSLLLDGLNHKIYIWATVRAFQKRYNPKADYFIRSGGAEIVGEGIIRVRSRPHVWVGMSERQEDGGEHRVIPKQVDIEFDKKIKLKDIVQTMNNAGLFDQKWEYGLEQYVI